MKVEFRGLEQGLSSPKDIVIGGPAGISVKEIKSNDGRTLEGTVALHGPLKNDRRATVSESSEKQCR